MAKFTGKGCQFMISDGAAPAVYAVVGQIQEIGAISITAAEVDVTTLDAGDYREFIQGFKDPGSCQLTVLYDPEMTDQGIVDPGLIALFASGEVKDCAIRWNSSATPGGKSYGMFKAFIRDMQYGALNPSDPQKLQPTWRLVGPLTVASALPTGATVREKAAGAIGDEPLPKAA
jgi:Lambda phage tail tube protein, TTP